MFCSVDTAIVSCQAFLEGLDGSQNKGIFFVDLLIVAEYEYRLYPERFVK